MALQPGPALDVPGLLGAAGDNVRGLVGGEGLRRDCSSAGRYTLPATRLGARDAARSAGLSPGLRTPIRPRRPCGDASGAHVGGDASPRRPTRTHGCITNTGPPRRTDWRQGKCFGVRQHTRSRPGELAPPATGRRRPDGMVVPDRSRATALRSEDAGHTLVVVRRTSENMGESERH